MRAREAGNEAKIEGENPFTHKRKNLLLTEKPL